MGQSQSQSQNTQEDQKEEKFGWQEASGVYLRKAHGKYHGAAPKDRRAFRWTLPSVEWIILRFALNVLGGQDRRTIKYLSSEINQSVFSHNAKGWFSWFFGVWSDFWTWLGVRLVHCALISQRKRRFIRLVALCNFYIILLFKLALFTNRGWPRTTMVLFLTTRWQWRVSFGTFCRH